MPRNSRITFQGGFYHIFNRGHNKGKIFYVDSDYEWLLKKISLLLKKGDWSIYCYCLMPNHYHFLIEEGKDSVSKFIGRLFTSYGVYFNNKYKRFGSLFQDRFKSKIIQKESYFMALSRYIHLNPVKSGLINNAADYPYGSLGEYTGKIKRRIINFNKVFKIIGESSKTLEKYVKFVTDGKTGDLDEYDPFNDKREVLGNRVFASHRKTRSFRLK